MLAEGDNEFIRTVAEKLLIYALGRGVDYYDQPALRRIADELEEEGYRWSSLVQAVVASEQFRMRRAPRPEESITANQQ